MNEALFITSFRYLEIGERIHQYIELMPGVNITNDETIKKGLLTPGLLQGIGAIEYQYLLEAPNIVFFEYDIDDFRELGASKTAPEVFLESVLVWIYELFSDAWLLKDHAMECDAAFLYVDPGSREMGWISNYLAMRPSFADGTHRKPIEMSINELKAWAEKNCLVESYLCERQSSSIKFMMHKGFSRTGRAMQFIAAARLAPDLAFKIAHYCSALETLFTTDISELAHKLSERVAFFLDNYGYDKSTVFLDVKKAYAVRSKLSHGDVLSSKQAEELPAISRVIDDYLRVIMNTLFYDERLLAVFDSHTQRIEEYFHELIFAGH